jgi:hypothetical protein
MQSTTTQQGDKRMFPTIDVSCRVDYREARTGLPGEHTSRLDSLSVNACTIHSNAIPDAEVLELRIYLPDGQWPLRIDHAKVSWGNWGGFAVEFIDMPAADQRRLREYLHTVSLLQEA